MSDMKTGKLIYALAEKLWPINRSLTGDGVRKTLGIIKEILPDLEIEEVPTGTKVFDWEIPKEWNVSEAWIKDSSGNKIVDFARNNLHLIGYSTPVAKKVNLEELKRNLHSLPELPDAIPYLTSYYSESWGFCLTDIQKESLKEDQYEVYIDSELKKGSLTYGELIIPGETKKEIIISTYVCHPSMANNELSGPCLTTYLANWISKLKKRKYTYRIIFIPETIGSITYLSRNLEAMKENIEAGFVITCVGDDRAFSMMPSRYGNTLADQVAEYVLKDRDPSFKKYSFLNRGSDERQYCAPGVDLPVVSIMRSKYATYPEYHTSLDDLSLVSPKGFEESFDLYTRAINILEKNVNPRITVIGEPQLGKRGLYPTLNTLDSGEAVETMMNFIAYCDGSNSILDMAIQQEVSFEKLYEEYEKLSAHGLLRISERIDA